jgi:energy-coupling factor transport system ATP-binding protein
MDSIIKTENLTFSYTGADDLLPKIVLDNLEFEIEKGTFVAVIGHNGSGKSTLAKHFNAILLPQGGRVLVDGMDTKNDELVIEIRRRIGMVFQNPDNQIVATIVEEDVAFAPENLGYSSQEIRRRVDEALKIVGMSEYNKYAPHRLSGGQKQRVAIAGALAMEPQCIIFDEPTAMLDPKGRQSIINVIRDLRDNRGVTVVLITHHMDEAIDADRVIVLSDGKIILDDIPKKVFLDAVKLKETGLGVPETTALLNDLLKDGFDVSLDALTIDECAETIFNALR